MSRSEPDWIFARHDKQAGRVNDRNVKTFAEKQDRE